MPASVKFGGPMGTPRAQIARTPSAETDAHARKVREQQRAELRASRVRMLREWRGIASEAESVFADNVTRRVCALVARGIADSPDVDASAEEAREAGFRVEFDHASTPTRVLVSLSQ